MSGEHGDVRLLPGEDTLGQGLGGTPVEVARTIVLHLNVNNLLKNEKRSGPSYLGRLLAAGLSLLLRHLPPPQAVIWRVSRGMEVRRSHNLPSVLFVEIFKSGFRQFFAGTPFEVLKFLKIFVANSAVEPSPLIEDGHS